MKEFDPKKKKNDGQFVEKGTERYWQIIESIVENGGTIPMDAIGGLYEREEAERRAREAEKSSNCEDL